MSLQLERRRGFSAQEQLRLLGPLMFVWAVGFVCLAAVALHGDVGELLLDPSWVGGAAWYAGVISQVGAVAWAAAAVVCGSAAWLAAVGSRCDTAKFLLGAAAITIILLFDDLFGFHSGSLVSIGISKQAAEVLIVAPVVCWLIRFRSDIARTRYQLLIASCIANSTSLLVDLFVNPGRFDFAVLFEDGPKFLGILAWATYFVVTSRDISRSVVRQLLVSVSPERGPPDEPAIQASVLTPETRRELSILK